MARALPRAQHTNLPQGEPYPSNMKTRSCVLLRTRCLASLALVVLCGTARAQTVFTPLRLPSPLPSQTVALGKKPEPALASSIDAALKSDLPLLQWGPVGIRPQLVYRYMNASGLEVGPGDLTDSRVHTLLLGTALDIGIHWRGHYSASRTLYSNRQFKDRWDHLADVGGSYAVGEWGVGISGTYSLASPIMVEVARQTRMESIGGGITLRRPIGQKTAFNVSGSASHSRAEPVQPESGRSTTRLNDWSSQAGFLYAFTERTQASLGVQYGFVDPSIGPSSTAIGPNVGVVWTPTDRLGFNVSGGWEQRRIHKAGADTLESLTYAGSARYRPFEVTTIAVGATRGIGRSYLVDAITKSRGWNVSLEQRLLQFLYFRAGYSERKARYLATEGTLPTIRADEHRTYDARLSVPIQARASVAVWYSRTKNSSSQRNFSFTSRQYGAEVSVRF